MNYNNAWTVIERDVKGSFLWRDMLAVREDSPWHREANVAEHTRMLLDWYQQNYASQRSEYQQFLSRVCCLFHDVGKPVARIEKHSEARGTYFAYHGHELISANMFMDVAAKSKNIWMEALGCDSANAYASMVAGIAFMIEHHLPWELKRPEKRKALKNTIVYRVGEEGHQAWIDFLMCDQHGRISDDQEAKLQRVYEWRAGWDTV